MPETWSRRGIHGIYSTTRVNSIGVVLCTGSTEWHLKQQMRCPKTLSQYGAGLANGTALAPRFYRGRRLCVVRLTCFILYSNCGTLVTVLPSMATSFQSKGRELSVQLLVGIDGPVLKPEQRYMLRSSVGVRCNNDCRYLFHFRFHWNTFRRVSDGVIAVRPTLAGSR